MFILRSTTLRNKLLISLSVIVSAPGRPPHLVVASCAQHRPREPEPGLEAAQEAGVLLVVGGQPPQEAEVGVSGGHGLHPPHAGASLITGIILWISTKMALGKRGIKKSDRIKASPWPQQ